MASDRLNALHREAKQLVQAKRGSVRVNILESAVDGKMLRLVLEVWDGDRELPVSNPVCIVNPPQNLALDDALLRFAERLRG